jgi:nucleotide-binding universal stress UspA family protein
MMKRILTAVGGSHGGLGTQLWAVQVAKRQHGSVTVAPLLDQSSWMRSMPVVLSSGHAARMLENQPWDATSDELDRVRQQSEMTFSASAIPWELVTLDASPWDSLVSETRFHDIVVFGLDGSYDPVIVPDFLRAVGDLLGRGACPVLAVPAAVREVSSVLIAFSGTVASARALKRFVHSKLWADVPCEIVCQSDDRTEANAHLLQAERYMMAHGRVTKSTSLQGTPHDLSLYTLESGADLIVAGSSHRNRFGIETSSEVLRALLTQSTLPVFVASA